MNARVLLAVISAACITCGAFAQPTSGSSTADQSSSARSLVPGKGRGYIGLSLGRSHYTSSCGATSFSCDSNGNAVEISVGSMLGNFWGVELGYLDMGRISRGGGTTRAKGLDLSLVGKTPVWEALGVFGKVGTTYGRTETTADAGSTTATGSERGFGLSYGAGVSYDFTPQLSATLALESHDFRFAGGARDPVRSTSLGLQYKY